MAEKHELAYVDYQSGMKYKDIAEKHGVTESAVKSWATRFWKKNDESKVATKKVKKLQPNNKKVATKKAIQRDVANEVEQVIENNELTDKQRLFCLYYIKSFNATKAYQKAYECSYEVAHTEGCSNLAKPSIKNEIGKLKQAKLNMAMLEPEDIFQKYMDIAFADITDYIQDVDQNIILRNLNEIDGTLIKEIKQSKDGSVSVKLIEKCKALDWLSEHMNMATEEQKTKIEMMKAQTVKINGEDLEIEDLSESEKEIFGDE